MSRQKSKQQTEIIFTSVYIFGFSGVFCSALFKHEAFRNSSKGKINTLFALLLMNSRFVMFDYNSVEISRHQHGWLLWWLAPNSFSCAYAQTLSPQLSEREIFINGGTFEATHGSCPQHTKQISLLYTPFSRAIMESCIFE